MRFRACVKEVTVKSILRHADDCCCCRREFLQSFGGAAGALTLFAAHGSASGASSGPPREKREPSVRVGFAYPPSASLKEQGYWSWPGSSFDPENAQREYAARIKELADARKVDVAFEADPIDTPESADRFVAAAKASRPDALVLVLFKKGHLEQVMKVLGAMPATPAILVAPIGVLLANSVRSIGARPRVHLINSLDVFGPIADALGVITAARRLRDSLLLNIRGDKPQETFEKHLGTRVRQIPHSRFVEAYQQIAVDEGVRRLAASYTKGAREIVEPTRDDITDAARCFFALKALIRDENADALMMECLTGLRKPHKHVPPCMGFMSLHDEGIVAGCQADLEATLTMMLVRQLFDRPSFQHNPCLDTERNHFFGAHCTAPSKMAGFDKPGEPYILRTHCEAGWGCVPQVLFPDGQQVTMLHYFTGESPKMSVYTGRIVRCHPKLPAGCRTNAEIAVDGLDDVRDFVYGGHQVLFYGTGKKQLELFCKLSEIELVG